MNNLLTIGGVILAFAALMAVVGLVMAIPIYYLWNWLMPTIFDLTEVTYLQAWGIFWLTSLLFRSSGSSSSN